MPTSTPITVALARFDDLLAHGLRWVIESDGTLEILAQDIEHARRADLSQVGQGVHIEDRHARAVGT